MAEGGRYSCAASSLLTSAPNDILTIVSYHYASLQYKYEYSARLPDHYLSNGNEKGRKKKREEKLLPATRIGLCTPTGHSIAFLGRQRSPSGIEAHPRTAVHDAAIRRRVDAIPISIFARTVGLARPECRCVHEPVHDVNIAVELVFVAGWWQAGC